MKKKSLYLFTLALVLTILAACSGQPQTQTPATLTPSSAAETAVAAVPNVEEIEASISAGLARISEQPHRENCNTDFGDTTVPTLIEFQPPDKRHILDTDNPNDMEAYVIGDLYYSYDPESQEWRKTQISSGSQSQAEPVISKFEHVGDDSLNGKPMQVYQYQQTAEQYGIALTQMMKVWVGVDDGLIYQTVSQGDVLGIDDKGDAFKQQATATCTIEYDGTIEVKAPIP